MDANRLRLDAEKMRERAQAKREEKEVALQRAADFSDAGSLDRAQSENKLGLKLEQDAAQYEKTAMDYDRRANDLELEASQIERQQADIQISAQAQIDKLEVKKNSLRGDM